MSSGTGSGPTGSGPTGSGPTGSGTTDSGTTDSGTTAPSTTTTTTDGTTTDPPANCGDGVRDADEACDGSDLGGETCDSLGFQGGTLACTGACQHDVSGCSAPACGTAATPTATECPSVCNDGCDFTDGVCQVQCGGGMANCTDETIACPPGLLCSVTCLGTGCGGATVQCAGGWACNLQCLDPGACADATLQCAGGPCGAVCTGSQTSCTGLVMECGTNDSELRCPQGSDGTPSVVEDAASSCSCNNNGC
jgi:hypothetical protein